MQSSYPQLGFLTFVEELSLQPVSLHTWRKIGVGRGTAAASNRCCTRIPEGPAAMALGKDLSRAMKSKLAGTPIASECISGDTGIVLLGA